MECQICKRQVRLNSALCRYHSLALRRLLRRYDAWQKAAQVEWKEYLRRLDSNPFTGAWIREIIAWSDAAGKSQEDLKRLANLSTATPQDP